MDNDKLETIINNYIKYYRKIYPDKIINNAFDNIDYNDPTSTNHILESFYDALFLHKNIDNDVYESIDEINIENIDNLYMLEMNNKTYISQSIISLLYVLDNFNGEWNIVDLK